MATPPLLAAATMAASGQVRCLLPLRVALSPPLPPWPPTTMVMPPLLAAAAAMAASGQVRRFLSLRAALPSPWPLATMAPSSSCHCHHGCRCPGFQYAFVREKAAGDHLSLGYMQHGDNNNKKKKGDLSNNLDLSSSPLLMDSRGQACYHRAAAAAAAVAAGDATDGEEPAAAELAPKAVRSKKKLAVEAQGGAAVRDDLTCPECGKVFMSDKAMYGHLRSHPLRKHKGAARLAAVAAAAADDASVAAGVKPRPWKVPRTKEEAELGDDRHPGRSPVTGKRGRPASSASSSGSAPAPAPPASSRLQLVITEEEEAAMTLLDIASGCSLDHQPTQPAHVADAALLAPASDQMPSVDVEQGVLAVAEHRTWEAEKPALVEHVFGIVKEHVAAVAADAEPQSPEAKTPVKLGPVTDQAVPEQLLAIAIANANANANAAPEPPPMMANAAPVPPPWMANGAGPVPPPIAVAPPPAPPIAGAAPPPPMANGAAAAAPPGGNPAPPAGPQPGVNMFDLNELPNEDAGENQQP
uniref:C2H2-type domain-containing protein n=1 Tax=Oryza barthii TaxID=65489 RepID=A0A0D3FWX3_9ORYZ